MPEATPNTDARGLVLQPPVDPVLYVPCAPDVTEEALALYRARVDQTVEDMVAWRDRRVGMVDLTAVSEEGPALHRPQRGSLRARTQRQSGRWPGCLSR